VLLRYFKDPKVQVRGFLEAETCSSRHYLQNKEGQVLRILRFRAADLLAVK